jgi:GntR family transcriptional regulator, sialic acid-inducible nan operon repressor
LDRTPERGLMTNDTIQSVLKQTPIRRTKLHEIVAQKLEGMIQSGELKPGDRLPSERDIMSAFDIGRPAVREALLALQSKGMIITENGRRARVRVPSVDNVFETMDGVVGLMINQVESLKNLFEARVFIEAAMARHAAKAIGEARIAELKTALDANRKAIGQRELFMQTDIAFHRVLFQTADNPIFDAVHAALVGWLMERWRRIVRTNITEKLAYRGHLQIYQAVKKADPDAADKAMRKHLAASWEIWEKQL